MRGTLAGFVNGVVFTVALALAAVLVAVETGVVPSRASDKPSRIERWAANTSLKAAIARETRGTVDPLTPSDDNVAAGLKIYAANCVVCHGASDHKPSILSQGFYIRAPQLAKDGVEDDPESEAYWKVRYGIRFTAMPAFGERLSDDDLWRVAMFVKRMDKLPPAVDALWKKVPSAAATPAP
jgi:mono/diheme cytochrome c family protein